METILLYGIEKRGLQRDSRYSGILKPLFSGGGKAVSLVGIPLAGPYIESRLPKRPPKRLQCGSIMIINVWMYVWISVCTR